MIEFPCHQCQQPLQSDPGTEGAYILCPYCNYQVQVPDAVVSQPAVPPVVPAELTGLLPAESNQLGSASAVHLQAKNAPPSARSWLSFFATPPLTGTVVLFEKGFVMLAASPAVCRWEDVTSFSETSKLDGTAKRLSFEVQDAQKRRYHLDDSLANMTDLGKAILHKSAPHLVPRLKALIDRGRGFLFGVFRLSLHGLERGSSVLRWDLLRSVSHTDAQVAVRRWGSEVPWAEVDLNQVGPLELFMPLVNSIAASHRDVLR